MAKNQYLKRATAAVNEELTKLAAKKLFVLENPSPQEIAVAQLIMDSAGGNVATAAKFAEALSVRFPPRAPNADIEKIMASTVAKELIDTTKYMVALLHTQTQGGNATPPLIGRMVNVERDGRGQTYAFPLEVSLASGKTLLQNTLDEAKTASRYDDVIGSIYIVGIPLQVCTLVIAIVATLEGSHATFCVGHESWIEIRDPQAADKLNNIALQACRSLMKDNLLGDTQNAVKFQLLENRAREEGEGKTLSGVLTQDQVEMLREIASDAVRESQLLTFSAFQVGLRLRKATQQQLEQQAAAITAELNTKLRQREREIAQLQTRNKTLERRVQLLTEEKTEAIARIKVTHAANDQKVTTLDDRLAGIFL